MACGTSALGGCFAWRGDAEDGTFEVRAQRDVARGIIGRRTCATESAFILAIATIYRATALVTGVCSCLAFPFHQIRMKLNDRALEFHSGQHPGSSSESMYSSCDLRHRPR